MSTHGMNSYTVDFWWVTGNLLPAVFNTYN